MNDPVNAPAPTWWQRVRWPLGVAVLLVGHTVLLLAALMAAGVSRNGAVTESAYEQGVSWDQLQEEKRNGERLGWSVSLEPASKPELNGDRRVTFRLFDRDDTPIASALLVVKMHHHSRADEITELRPRESQPGVFEAIAPMRRAGLYHVDARIEKGADHCRIGFDYWLREQKGDRS